MFFFIIFSSSISNLLSLCVFSLSFRRFSSFLTCFFSSCLRLFLFSIFFFSFLALLSFPLFISTDCCSLFVDLFFFSSSFCLLPYPMYVLSSNFLFSPLRHRCFFVIVIMVSHHRHRLRLPRHELVEEWEKTEVGEKRKERGRKKINRKKEELWIKCGRRRELAINK